MKDTNTPTNEAKAAAGAAKSTGTEAANVVVDVLKPRTKIGKAICGLGRLSFPITKQQAKDLQDLGLVRIVGTTN